MEIIADITTKRGEIRFADMREYISSVPVVVEKRRDDWTAYIKDHPEMWEAGRTPREALEKLCTTRGLELPVCPEHRQPINSTGIYYECLCPV